MVAVMAAFTDGDMRADADIADMDACADLGGCGGCSQKDQRENRSGKRFHGFFLGERSDPGRGGRPGSKTGAQRKGGTNANPGDS